MRPQIHSQVQQKPQVRPESPEVIYEVPDWTYECCNIESTNMRDFKYNIYMCIN
jgi:hypothetical protein